MEATKLPASGLTRGLALVALALVAGCRAQPAGPGDAAGDMAVSDLARSDDLANADASEPLDASCLAVSSEICGNGCDDDRNGFIDDDDPACTPQVVATFQGGSPELTRLILEPLASRFLDGNAVADNAHGVYHGGFARGVAFLALDGGSRILKRVTLPGASGKGVVQEFGKSYTIRDVCIFNGELIVVDFGGKLHRMMADATTVIGTVEIPRWMPYNMTTLLSACATDGQYLYVASHSVTGMPTQFDVFDTNYATVGAPIDMPTALLNDGYDRCLDFAWTRRGFYGLWTNSGGVLNDSNLVSELHAPFALDGAVGPPVDAGVLHGLGEFTP